MNECCELSHGALPKERRCWSRGVVLLLLLILAITTSAQKWIDSIHKTMATRPRRPLISLQAHLQSLLLSTSLEASSAGPSSTPFLNPNGAGPSSSSSVHADLAQDNLQQLGPIIKNLDEAGQADAFLRLLREYARGEEERIKTICDDNSQVSSSSMAAL